MSGEPKVEVVSKEVSPGVVETTTTTTFPDGSVKVEKRTQTTSTSQHVVETKIPVGMDNKSKRMSSRHLNVVGFSAAEEHSLGKTQEAGWIVQQRKAFMRWCNAFLAQRTMAIKSFEQDLQDGIMLINLLECLSGREIKGYTKNPRMKIQKCVNIQAALDFITKDQRLYLESIGPQDVYEGKSKLILGIIWTLILHFQLAAGKWGSGSVKGDLLEWCNRVLATQGLKVFDFKTSWSDGRAFLGLVNYLQQQNNFDLLDGEGLDVESTLNLAFDVSTKTYEIPQLLDAEDMHDPDEQSVMSYVSYFRQKDKVALGNAAAAAKPKAAPVEEAPKEIPRQQAQLTVVPNNTTAEGEGLRQALCGKRAQFVVTTRDKVNQILYIKGTQITVTLEFEGVELKNKVTVVDQEDANYNCDYLVNKSGMYYIMIFCNGQPIRKEKWWVKLRPAEVAGGFSEAKGNGLSRATAGIAATFTVITRDQYGNASDQGGATIVGTLTPKSGKGSSVEATFQDKNDGTYDGSYVVEKIGQYTLALTANGQDVKASPFLVQVTSEGVDSSSTTAEGAGLHNASAGVVAEYTVKTSDRFGNVIEDIEAVIQANLEPVDNDEAEPVECSVRNNHDGTYTVTYTPLSSGTYALNTRCNGAHITDSPHDVIVSSGPAAANTTIATGDGLRNAQCGKVAKFQVKTKDEFRNIVTSSDGVVIAGNLIAGNDNDAECTVQFSQNGTWNAEYIPKVAGNYPLQVTLNGKDIRGSKFNVTVIPGAIDSSKTEAQGEGLVGAKAGETARFIVIARDEFGNEVKETDATKLGLQASLEGPENLDVTFGDQRAIKGVRSFPAEYLATKPGEYILNVLAKSQPISGSPFTVAVIAGKPSAGNCHAEGEGLHTATAGTTAEFVVMVCDEWGNVVKVDEKTSVTTSMDGPAPITPKQDSVKDNGSLCWSYLPTVASTSFTKYALTIKLDGKDIIGSPFSVFVSPAVLSSVHCYAEGEGLSKAIAGEQSKFIVHTLDAYGNTLPVGGQSITSELVSGSTTVPVKIVDLNDGTYSASYVATVAGKYTLKVHANGEDVKDAPYTVTVAEGAVSAARCVAEGEGLTTAVSNQLAFFRVIAKDSYDNVLTRGGLSVSAFALFGGSADHANNFKVNVKDNENGTYSAEYTALKKGAYNLIVTVEDESVTGSPFKLNVASGAPSNNNTVAEGEGLSTVVCGEKGLFSVITKDDSGNRIESGGADITGKLSGPASLTVSVVDNNDGTYSASYEPIVAGTYSLDVNCDSAPIKDSPFTVTALSGPVDASRCIATGEGLSKASAGHEATFEVRTKDGHGNDLKKGGESVAAALKGAASGEQLTAVITDNGDGTYTGVYTPRIVDSYQLDITVSGGNIKDSPFTVNVQPGDFDASKSTAEGEGLSRAVAGDNAVFVVQARDSFGNKLTRGGAKIQSSLSGTDSIDVTIRDNNDGTYGAQYKAYKTGSYSLTVGSDGTGIVGSEFSVSVLSSEVQADKCVAEGEGLSRAIAGETAEFTIEARDAFDNAVPVDRVTGHFTAILTYSNGESVEVEIESGETLYLSQYIATVSGIAKLDVLYNNGHIAGSPYTVDISPGSYSATFSELDGSLARTCGESFILVIRLKDAFGNLLGRSVDISAWNISINPNVVFKVVDNGDGTYNLEFEPIEKSGEYSLTVELGAAGAISGSPFTLVLSPGPAADGVWINGPEDTVAGQERELKLQALDAYGNKLSVGHGDFKFTLEGPDAGAKAVVKDENNGTYSSILLLTKSGVYTIHVFLNGSELSSSPWTFNILPGTVKGGYCIALGSGLETATAGEAASFLVQSRDEFGNEITIGGATVVATLLGKGETVEIIGSVTDSNDGIYSVEYVAEKSIVHTLSVSLNAEDVQKSPFTVHVVPGRVSTSTSSVIGETPRSGIPGAPYIRLQARDRFGNDKTTGGDEVKVYLTKPVKRPAYVTDRGDGTYDIRYPYGIEEGDWGVEVELANEKMTGESIPQSVHVNDTEPLADEQVSFVAEALPKSSKKLSELLLHLSPEDREQFFAELKALQS